MNSRVIDANSEYLGVSRLCLMENAGREIAREAEKFDSIAIFCGLGNNGGDGLVAARHLSSIGKEVMVYTLAGERSEECQRNFSIIQKLDTIKIKAVRSPKDCKGLEKELKGVELIVDALLGTGVEGELREPVKSLVEKINSSKAKKLGVDVPTPGIKADVVISLHSKKTPDAKVVGIGIPKEAELYCGPGDVLFAIPDREGGEHKGDFGRLLVIGGSKDFIGTPSLVGGAAFRTGVDLVQIACPRYVARRIPFNPDLLVSPLDSEDFLRKEDVKKILGLSYDAVVIGNGLGLRDDSKYALKRLLRKIEKPVVLDADALKLVKPEWLNKRHIVTPHAHEFKTLFGEFDDEFNQLVGIVHGVAKKTRATVILKGARDIVSDGKETRLNRTGNPGMTVGGTGDTLAGIIGALACRTDNFSAACAGVFLNGLAGDLAFHAMEYSFTATDLTERIPQAIKFCNEFR